MVCGVKETPANSIKIKMVSVCVIEHKYGGEYKYGGRNKKRKKKKKAFLAMKFVYNSIQFSSNRAKFITNTFNK